MLEEISYADRFEIARKEVLTTGDVGKALHIAARTVSAKLDNGSIPHGRTVPGSQDRRLSKDILRKQMKKDGLPTDWLTVCQIHVGENPSRLFKNIRQIQCSSIFELGILMTQNCVVRITLDHQTLNGQADLIRKYIQRACKKRGYPVPSVHMTEKKKSRVVLLDYDNGATKKRRMNGHPTESSSLSVHSTERMEDWML
ncbi:hypothetical protein A3D88_00155 [Candidatus Peribacteria bacterium RIFCSPHIGHO2_02_FULL_52_16]|nr:MAG: hypothetical protein A2706_01135 [Candidatus Peribacteria bacterium RIFCSPHIGHO2_01_FULL_51_35]OGJ61536.1 MAG: hypothetical protein A3D88_00155 [Candidatus Peribacteria bacterium RIFCSPHIGHO2_02_FULL_52_16]